MGEANFNRPLRRNELVLNALELVPKDAMSDLVSPWLAEQGVEDDKWILKGAAAGLCKRYTIIFQGTPMFAEQLADKVYKSVRKADGSWKEFFIQSPIDNRKIQVFIGRDANGKMLATASLGKKALLLAHRIAPNVTVNLLKFEGYLTDGR